MASEARKPEGPQASYSRIIDIRKSEELDDDEVDVEHGHPREASSRSRWRPASAVLAILIAFNAVLAGVLLLNLSPARQAYDGLYSPAQDALEREDVVFKSSFGHQVTEYQGRPNDENNALWHELYSYGVSRISAAEARPLVNKTLPIPNDPGYYITSLGVFHQLHCLNLVRKGLYGDVDWTNRDELRGIEHLDHCVDIIRQNLMCTADVTPLTWTRDPRDGKAKEVAQVIHTCRNWDSIRRWAMEHKMVVDFDVEAVVRDDELGWGGYEIDFPT